MRSLVLIALAVALVAAQTQTTSTNPLTSVIAFNDPRCTGSTWQQVDLTSSYTSSFNGTLKVCVKTYISVCAGPYGLQYCNNYYGQCTGVGYNWQDKVVYPNIYTVNQPQVCASAGQVMAPDTKVIAIAEVIFGFFLFFIAFAFAIPVVRNVSRPAAVALTLQLATSFLLMFSYYYLNGIITLGASIAAVGLFRRQKPALTGAGILILLSAFYWVTYRYGLGNTQHQSRFTAGLATTPTYENMCLNYYRGYFWFNPDLNAVDADPSQTGWGYCSRNWLTAVLFFQIFSEILLVSLTTGGLFALLAPKPKPEAGKDGEVEKKAADNEPIKQ